MLSLDDIFISSDTECHPQVSQLPDVMDTLYDFEDGGKAQGVNTPPVFNLHDSPALADLDGNHELSYDIKQLLEQSLQVTGNVAGSSPSHQLFGDLLTTTSPNTSQTQQAASPRNTEVGDQVTFNQYNDLEELESMPHIVLETDQSGQAILNFVKIEPDNAEEEYDDQSSIGELSVPPSPAPSGSSGRNSYKAKAPSKRRQLEKGSEEYTLKRQRNNIAVRKSRDKAKLKQKETEDKVRVLTDQNKDLQNRVDLLTKELNVLKGLFANVGAALPKEYKNYIAKTINRT